MLSFLTQSTPTAPSAGAAAASAMFDDDFFAQRTRAAFSPLSHHSTAPPHFPFGGFPVHHDPFGSEFHSVCHFAVVLSDQLIQSIKSIKDFFRRPK